eukprot:TRINITY_DN14280_c0_g2_i1.p2 TRINITY_DN14280_c0_g2~~TRINITY_DN14280_c0_g2_i1.p2  ORF type:complete len:335 (-),score=105.63 TRINITY_DN14280_c0_g2_i1:356-1360(-)
MKFNNKKSQPNNKSGKPKQGKPNNKQGKSNKQGKNNNKQGKPEKLPATMFQKIPVSKPKRMGMAVEFDDDERSNFVSGFRKRKLERQRIAKLEQLKQEKEAKIKERQKKREMMEQAFKEEGESRNFGLLPNRKKKLKDTEDEDLRASTLSEEKEEGSPEPVEQDVITFDDDEDKEVTVTTTTFDSQVGASLSDPDSSGSERDSNSDEEEVEVKPKRQRKSKNNKNAFPSVAKNSFPRTTPTLADPDDNQDDDTPPADQPDVDARVVDFTRDKKAPKKKNRKKYSTDVEELGISYKPKVKKRPKPSDSGADSGAGKRGPPNKKRKGPGGGKKAKK